MNAKINMDIPLEVSSYIPDSFIRRIGTFNKAAKSINGYARLLHKWRNDWNFSFRDISDFITFGYNFFIVSIAPFVHLNCCDFKLLISAGNSAGDVKFTRYLNFHPLICALYDKSRSSVSVSASQFPASKIHSFLHIPICWGRFVIFYIPSI